MSNESNSNGQQSESNRPAMTFRYGAIKCTVWKNQTRNGPMYNTIVTRSSKDGENWRDSSSFGSEDFPTVAKAFLVRPPRITLLAYYLPAYRRL
jgi:hypothetical protein